MFVGKARGYSRVEHLQPYPQILNNASWVGFSGTNIIFYYEHLKISDVSSFITLATDVT
jgi:hypothetical protein